MKNFTTYQKKHLFCRPLSQKLRAFSLTEVMIVLVIIGILVLLAIPNLLPLVTRAKSTEAKLQLQHVYTLQKNYFYEHSKYAANLFDLGFEQEKLTTEGGQANYRIEIVASGNSTFLAKAVAVTDFDGNGTFNVWEIDEQKALREIVKD